jgi:hypothetical protein
MRWCDRGVGRQTEETVGFPEWIAQFSVWKTTGKDSSEACAVFCQNCAVYSFFPSGITSHSKISQCNWECIAPLRRTERDDKKCMLFSMQSASYSCRTLTKLEFSKQISERYSNLKFQGNPFTGGRVVPCRRVEGQRRADITLFSILRTPRKQPHSYLWEPYTTQKYTVWENADFTVLKEVGFVYLESLYNGLYCGNNALATETPQLNTG